VGSPGCWPCSPVPTPGGGGPKRPHQRPGARGRLRQNHPGASGGGGNALPTLDHSGLWSSINDRGQVGFNRDPSRSAPYNVVADLAQISAAFKDAEGVRDVGFTWANHDPRLATAKVALSVNTLVGSTNVSFVWNALLGRYVRSIGGQLLLAASGAPVAKPT